MMDSESVFMGPDSNTNPHYNCVFLSKRDVGDLRKGLRSLWESKICKERLKR